MQQLITSAKMMQHLSNEMQGMNRKIQEINREMQEMNREIAAMNSRMAGLSSDPSRMEWLEHIMGVSCSQRVCATTDTVSGSGYHFPPRKQSNRDTGQISNSRKKETGSTAGGGL
eukprot:TRINITY_DN66615_c3_g6_i1.p1 TRINITY_DN66615_c3_g6~~TRINITY_DN66615_c3_g6_i1.p1  ORF type:complete len:115 (+),score=12.49 TRINITY_DN66615_c3_g6_i1:283-627(+)